LIAAGADPDTVRRHGRSGLDFLASRRGPDGHYRYSSTSDQTPVWVTGQALVASQRKAFPLAAVARTSSTSGESGGNGGGEAKKGTSQTRAAAAAGSGDGRPLDTDRFGKEQGRPQREADSGGSGEAAANPESGGTSAPASPPKDSGPPNEAEAGSEGDGDTSPLLPIGIGLAVAIVVLGGGWLASRRLTAKS
jgi:hypothetical protein